MKLSIKSWLLGALSALSLAQAYEHDATMHDIDVDGHRTHLRHLYDPNFLGTLPFGRDLATTCPATQGTCPVQIFSSKWKNDACTSCYQGIGCSAGDLKYHSCRLVVPSATEKCFKCECGAALDVNIECIVENRTGSARLTAVAMGYFSNSGNCGSSSCFTALCVDQPKDKPLQPNVPTKVTFTGDSGKPIKWICGSQAQFKDIVLMSQPTSGSCLNLSQCGPKCDFFQTFPIQTPVGINVNTPICANGALTFTLSGTLTGLPNFNVKIECSIAGAVGYPVTIPNISTNDFSKSGLPPCNGGDLIVTATDSNTDGCTATDTIAAPNCCFTSFTCKDPFPKDRVVNGCSGESNPPNQPPYGDVFNLNPERCKDPEYSVSTPVVAAGGDVCSGFQVSRTYTATVSDGTSLPPYTKQCVETWTVKDTEKPKITANDMVVPCGANNSPEAFASSFPKYITVTDNCDSSPQVTWSKKSESTPASCSSANNYAVKTYTLTFTASDKCSNTDSDDMTLTIQDVTAPTLDPKCGTPISIGCNLNVNDPGCTASDECALNAVAVPTNTCCLKDNKLRRTWTTTDHCGNAASVQQNVQLSDTLCTA